MKGSQVPPLNVPGFVGGLSLNGAAAQMGTLEEAPAQLWLEVPNVRLESA